MTEATQVQELTNQLDRGFTGIDGLVVTKTYDGLQVARMPDYDGTVHSMAFSAKELEQLLRLIKFNDAQKELNSKQYLVERNAEHFNAMLNQVVNNNVGCNITSSFKGSF
jgi:hypothetical protein